MKELSTELADWKRRGQTLDVFGREVFVIEAGEPDAEPLVILHGYPSSSFDYHQVLGLLAERFRVIIHDHIGFGLSAKPEDYSYSLIEQADIALGVWRQLGVGSGHLLAHDYGTSVATELLARRERDLLDFDVDAVTLCNGSMHVELAEMSTLQKLLPVRGVGPLVAKLANHTIFRAQIRRILGEGGSVSDHEIDLMWEALEYAGGRKVIPQIARYQYERKAFWHRWIGALKALDLPCHVVWGRQDAVAVAEIAETLAGEVPGARLTWLDDLGHYPMLEDPNRWARAVLSQG
jgi:pimeloyl-ACP methyl ester carboxylesterase